jgi:adiponectin receptor
MEKDKTISEKLPSSPKKALTILWNDLPAWMQDNHYIQTGYRPQSNSYHTSFLSLLHIHNETVNIYTHLLGALFALLAGTFVYTILLPRFQHATQEDVFVFACFFGGAVGCLGMSATYHTISNHSEAVAKMGNRLDYMGIVVLIWGSFVPSIYYGFAGERRLVGVYWTMVCFQFDCCATLITKGC